MRMHEKGQLYDGIRYRDGKINLERNQNINQINFIGNNNSLSLSVCSSFSNIDNAFIEPKNHIFKKNIKSTFLKIMV